jgi:uncharacterized protein with NRDE domain
MCLIFLSLNDHPNYKLIIATNRDEFYTRRTLQAQYWYDQPNILGGKDLFSLGTWMAMTTTGRIAMVTNYRDLTNIKKDAPSRGHLVSDYLKGDEGPVPYMDKVSVNGSMYNGFNLIAGNPNELYYYSNYSKGVVPISPGVHGLSNHLLDTPWPKVSNGISGFKEILKSPEINPEKLFEFLYDEKQAPDKDLPDTGVGLEKERMLSSMFIKSPDYGSRCSTVLLVNRSNNALYHERTYDLADYSYVTQRFSLHLPNS